MRPRIRALQRGFGSVAGGADLDQVAVGHDELGHHVHIVVAAGAEAGWRRLSRPELLPQLRDGTRCELTAVRRVQHVRRGMRHHTRLQAP